MIDDLRPGSVLSRYGRRGRLSALKAWLLYGLLVPLLSGFLFGAKLPSALLDSIVATACALAVPFGVGTQRLHDLGRSGSWIWLVALAPLLLAWALPTGSMMILAQELIPAGQPSMETGASALVLFALWTVAALPLLVWPGQPGPNGYGPPSVGRSAVRAGSNGCARACDGDSPA